MGEGKHNKKNLVLWWIYSIYSLVFYIVFDGVIKQETTLGPFQYITFSLFNSQIFYKHPINMVELYRIGAPKIAKLRSKWLNYGLW